MNWEQRLKEISVLTDYNDHNGAYQLGAHILEHTLLEKKLKMVGEIRDLQGSVDMNLGNYQYALYNELMEFAKKKLTPKDYYAFYSCF